MHHTHCEITVHCWDLCIVPLPLSVRLDQRQLKTLSQNRDIGENRDLSPKTTQSRGQKV